MQVPIRTSASRLLMVALAAIALLVISLVPPAAANEHSEVTPARVAGDTRHATAAEIARLTFDSATVALVVAGRDFPDALSASYGAGVVAGPIVLVEHASVPAATLQVLEDLGVTTTVIIGGVAAVSEAVEAELRANGYTTDRVAGIDRYQTASSVATRYAGADGQNVGELDGRRTAIVASGERFPDALAAGPVSGAGRFPLLLTPRDGGDPSANAAINELDIEHVLIVGGSAAVSPAAEEQLRAQGVTVDRLAGETRTDTARIVAEFARQRLGWTAQLSLLARGDGFADALAGSIHGATTASPILLARTPHDLSTPTRIWFRDACPEVEVVRALGGTSAVSRGVLADAVEAAEQCLPGSDAGQDFLVAPQEVVTQEPGVSQEMRISQRYDDEFTGPVDVALFPCANVAATESPVVFADADADGVADGTASTDTGAAVIAAQNDRPVNAKVVRDVGPSSNGILYIDLHSDAEDCAVLVVWDDVDGDGAVAVDADGHATEPFGVGEVRWRA